MLSLVVSPLPFSFWVSDVSRGGEGSALHVLHTSPVKFCVVDATFQQ